MKIVVDVRAMGSKPSGIGIYTYNFLKELINYEHEIVLLSDVAISTEIKQMELLGITVLCYGKSVYQSQAVYKYFKFINIKLSELQPDLFWEPNALIPIRIKNYRGKIMITVHDIFPITHREYFNWKFQIYFRLSLKKTIKQTDSIIYNSAETKQLTECFEKKAKEKRSLLGYIIVENKKNHSSIKRKYNTPFFLYIGNIEKRKGVDLLLKAYKEYCSRGGINALYLAGKMRELGIQKLLKNTQKSCKKLYYLGYVDSNEMNELYNQCECFVFPSKAEGFGIPVIEAMEYGKPILVSELSIFKEIVGENINYFKLECDEADTVMQLCTSMFTYKKDVNKSAYEEIRNRYSNKQLGRNFREFLAVESII